MNQWLAVYMETDSFVFIYKSNLTLHAVSHVIPATMPIVGGSNPDAKVEKEAEAGPPHRPEHDAQIEEFVREQHRSNRAETLSDGRA